MIESLQSSALPLLRKLLVEVAPPASELFHHSFFSFVGVHSLRDEQIESILAND